jgi:hypothetical protein
MTSLPSNTVVTRQFFTSMQVVCLIYRHGICTWLLLADIKLLRQKREFKTNFLVDLKEPLKHDMAETVVEERLNTCKRESRIL